MLHGSFVSPLSVITTSSLHAVFYFEILRIIRRAGWRPASSGPLLKQTAAGRLGVWNVDLNGTRFSSASRVLHPFLEELGCYLKKFSTVYSLYLTEAELLPLSRHRVTLNLPSRGLTLSFSSHGIIPQGQQVEQGSSSLNLFKSIQVRLTLLQWSEQWDTSL